MFVADVKSLQQPDGSFAGDAWGEIDTRCQETPSPPHKTMILHADTTISFQCHLILHKELSSSCRFSYCALSCCRLLGHPQAIDIQAAVEYVARCQNIDGGFGCTPGQTAPNMPLTC